MDVSDNVFHQAITAKTDLKSSDSESVYKCLSLLWDCHTQTDENQIYNCMNVVNAYLAKDGDTSAIVSKDNLNLIKYLPQYLLVVLENTHVPDSVLREVSLSTICEILSISDEDKCAIVKYTLLLLIYQIISLLPEGTVFSLLNKCIVLDNMGNRAFRGSVFEGLLRKLFEKVIFPKFRSTKYDEILYETANLCYRLNKYEPALELFIRYLEWYIKEDDGTMNTKTYNNCLLTIAIAIAYCLEKTNQPSNLNLAIKMLCSIQDGIAVELSEIAQYTTYDINQQGITDEYHKSIIISLTQVDTTLRAEILHALAHFYNERAVFHRNISYNSYPDEKTTDSDRHDRREYENDIFSAHKYMNLAKRINAKNDFDSCHGLICYENLNFTHALDLYRQALMQENVKGDDNLRFEILFYLAQTLFASKKAEDITEAYNLIEEFKTYCKDILHNDDATLHADIMRIKSELAALRVFDDNFNNYDFQYALNSIKEKRPSLYIPYSVHAEWEMIRLALRAFYFLQKIKAKELSFYDGMEELSDTFSDLLCILKPLEIKERFECASLLFQPLPTDISEDGLFLVEYQSLQFLCVGDFKNFTEKYHNLEFLGRIKRGSEASFVAQIAQNNRPDVILFSPSENYVEYEKETNILSQILTTKVCTIAMKGNAEHKIESIRKKVGRTNSPVYYTDDFDDLLRIAFCLRMFELLTHALAVPTPLLGLAPLGGSQAYKYQAGELRKSLVLPDTRSAEPIEVAVRFKSIKKALTNLDGIQHELLSKAQSELADTKAVIEECLSVAARNPALHLLAFFPDHKQYEMHKGNFSTPFSILNESIRDDLAFIPFYEIKAVFSSLPENQYDAYERDYDACDAILSSTLDSEFCQAGECALDCQACVTSLDVNDEKTLSVIGLVRHIFPLEELSGKYKCVWKKITLKTGNLVTGLLIAFIKTNITDKNSPLYTICKELQDITVAPIVSNGNNLQETNKSTKGCNTKVPDRVIKAYEKALSKLEDYIIHMTSKTEPEEIQQRKIAEGISSESKTRSAWNTNEYNSATNRINAFLSEEAWEGDA